MKYSFFLYFFCLLGAFFFSCSRNQGLVFQHEDLLVKQLLQKKDSYFVTAPIKKLSAIQSPCLDVQIGDVTFSMELDLGFRGDLTITSDFISQIKLKNPIGTKTMYGIRSKEYPTALYKIPKVKIGQMIFSKLILEEESKEFLNDSVFVQDGTSPSPRDPGRIGWKLFYNSNLLIDIRESKIAFSDSLDTLKKWGYKIDNFVKTPLLIERGLVEFNANTPDGFLRCTLDTGATWNLLNKEDGQPIDQAMWDSDNTVRYSFFEISDQNFGETKFHRIPINIPIQIEAILGMEFFREHLVFLDFANQYAYFMKY